MSGRPLWAILLLLLLTAHASPAQHGRSYPMAASDAQPVALLPARHPRYLVTTEGVLERQGRRFVPRYQSASPIRCALLTDSLLWLGTAAGLAAVSPDDWQPRPVPGTAPALHAPITTLLLDANKQLWLGAAGYGAYALTPTGWQAQLSVPALNTGVGTADGAVWLGTNIGLYCWRDQQWTRYNEEGVANHEIPDNMVDRLLPDHAGNLWVLTSAGVSVLPVAGPADEHVPTVRYVGRPGTELYSLAYLPGQGHLLATSLGCLLLPAQATGEPAGFAEPTTDRVETPQVLVPLALPGQSGPPQLLQTDAGRLWVVGAAGVSQWRLRAVQRLSRAASRRTPAPGVARQ